MTPWIYKEIKSQIVTDFSQAVKNNRRSGSIITYFTAATAGNYAIDLRLYKSHIFMLFVAVEIKKLEWTVIERVPLL